MKYFPVKCIISNLMDNFNRILSFIIGLVVVMIVVAIVANRLNMGRKVSTLSNSLKRSTPTPSPLENSPTTTGYNAKLSPTSTVVARQNITATQTKTGTAYTTKGGVPSSSTIPSTGASTLLIPLALGGSFLGGLLRKSGKK